MPLDTFDVAVRLRGRKPEVQIWRAPAPPRPTCRFVLPWSKKTTADILEAVEVWVQSSILHASGTPPPALEGSLTFDPRKLGETLFQSLFSGDIQRLLESQLAGLSTGAEAAGGLRLRLCFDADLSDVAALPWELLCHPERRDFLSRSSRTPVSRFLSVEATVGELRVRPPLKVVLVGPSPREMAALDLSAERDYLRRGLAAYSAVEVCDVQPPTLERLVEILERDPEIHILHFMGHGGFESSSGRGALLFEGSRGERHVVAGEVFAEQLRACPSLRLVVLNCCQSGRIPRRRGQDPFTGVATALLRKGLPAVVAMQFAVSDQAALTFAGKFYSSLAAGDPVDVATARARMAIYRHAPHSLEWITPVLFLQVADGRILIPEAEPQPAPRSEPEPVPSSWQAVLARLDGAIPARRRLERLGRLFPLSCVLSAGEVEVLGEAALLHAGCRKGSDEAATSGSSPSPEIDAAAARCAAAAEPGADLTDPSLHTTAWRLTLLAALLRLGEIVGLDRDSTAPSRAGRMPEAGADILDWIAFFTREVRIPRGGIAQFVLEAPSPEWIDPLKRATSLRLEAAWQELRAVLLPAGLVMAAAPSEIVLGSTRPPSSVLDHLREFGEEIGDAIPQVRHLGEDPPELPLDILLPLPNSVVAGEETLALAGEFPGLLEVAEEESGLGVYRRPIAAGEREVVLDLEGLRADRWYLWHLYTEEFAGRLDLVRLGRLRPLSSEERQRLSADGDIPFRGDLLALGLHDQLLRELAPSLRLATATFEETALAHRLIVDAYEWIQGAAPSCSLVDAYRNAAIWLQTQMSLGGPKP